MRMVGGSAGCGVCCARRDAVGRSGAVNAVQKLRQLVDEIRGSGDGFAKVDAWALAGRLLARTPGVDRGEAQRVVEAKDAEGLEALVHGLEHPEEKKRAAPTEGAREVSDEEARHAMKAFRKRLRLARLADESRLSGRRLTKGRASEIDAIIPPSEIPTAVWAALVERGELEYTGEGFYTLPKPPG